MQATTPPIGTSGQLLTPQQVAEAMNRAGVNVGSSDPLLTEEQTSALLGVKPGTLQVWRSTRRYPLQYVKVGRLVRYRLSAVEKFIAERTGDAIVENSVEERAKRSAAAKRGHEVRRAKAERVPAVAGGLLLP